jgi:hypothetical protein
MRSQNYLFGKEIGPFVSYLDVLGQYELYKFLFRIGGAVNSALFQAVMIARLGRDLSLP